MRNTNFHFVIKIHSILNTYFHSLPPRFPVEFRNGKTEFGASATSTTQHRQKNPNRANENSQPASTKHNNQKQPDGRRLDATTTSTATSLTRCTWQQKGGRPSGIDQIKLEQNTSKGE